MCLYSIAQVESNSSHYMLKPSAYNIAYAGSHYHLAANLPNVGQIANLPLGSTVETPVHVDGAGIHPVHVGALPEAVAELCRRELMVAQLSVDAAVEGSYEKALQCLLLDPVITDMHVAKTTLETLKTLNKFSRVVSIRLNNAYNILR